MDFTNFTEQFLPYIQLLVIGFSALVLKQKLDLKNAEIDSLSSIVKSIKEYKEILDVDVFKKNLSLNLENKDLEYKKVITDLEEKANFKFSEDNPEFIKVFDQIRSDWSNKQAELLRIVGYFILQANIKQREEILSTIPYSRSLIEDVLAQIEKTKK